jgi:cephalosporin hydroxylase
MTSLQRALRDPKRAALFAAARLYNVLIDLRKAPLPPPSPLRELEDVRTLARKRSDISDHLPRLFVETLEMAPRLVVELGVRGGDSTFVLERAARLHGAALVSVDIDDCARVSGYERWHFVREDDVAFAARFASWCSERGIEPRIDVLFIDTSHLYEHTKREIEAWFPLLSERCRVFFHDTNLRPVYFRADGSMGLGWDNQRGVIRAIEEHLGARLPEQHDFIDARRGWVVRHYARCSGLTVLTRQAPAG